jgi:hypothetical protein
MSTLAEFKQKPHSIMHDLYNKSFLSLWRKPEYASGEMVLGSIYRAIMLREDGVRLSEAKVAVRGRHFVKGLESEEPADDALFSNKQLLEFLGAGGLVASPKSTSQSKKRFLSLTPLVPDVSIYSAAVRLSGSPWNPGELTKDCIRIGSRNSTSANSLWRRLHESLAVDDNDDIFARFYESELRCRRKNTISDADLSDLDEDARYSALEHPDSMKPEMPATRFVEDLEAVLSLKRDLTRRQWVSLVESIVRLGLATQVLWHCHTNYATFQLFRSVVESDNPPPTAIEVAQTLSMPASFIRYGQKAGPGALRQYAQRMLVGRIGLNLTLFECEGVMDVSRESLSSPAAISKFLGALAESKRDFPADLYSVDLERVKDEVPKITNCEKGLGKNLHEFLLHALSQRQTSDPLMQGYDQGYTISKSGLKGKGQWIVSFGPLLLLGLVHATCVKSRGPSTVEDLCNQLAEYGIELRPDSVASSAVGNKLRSLGLVLDSPDAEGGMVLVDPFTSLEDSNA